MECINKTIKYIFHGKLKHISRFSTVGAANTFIDFVVFTICHSFLGFSYIVSQILGYSFGILNSFMFNKKWTFKDRNSSKNTFYEFSQFTIVNLISLIITIVFMNLLVGYLNINVYISKIAVTFIAQITNFFAYKLWIFKSYS